MAVQSINTLQNSDNYNQIAKEYILESLANLGQRYNVKGDSIGVKSIPLGTTLFGNIQLDNKILVIDKQDNEHIFYLTEQLSNGTWNLNGRVETINDSDNDIPDNGRIVLPYNPSINYTNPKFEINGNYHKIIIRQDYATAVNKTNFILERYDSNTGSIVDGVRIFKRHFNDDTYKKYYLLVHIKSVGGNAYDINMYLSNNEIKDYSDTEIYEFIEGLDLDNLVISDVFSPFGWPNPTTGTLDENNRINCSENLDLFSSDDQDILQNSILYSFTEDLTNIYPYLKSLWSSSKFGSEKASLISILSKLYDSIITFDNSNSSDSKIYIPLVRKYIENEEEHIEPYSITCVYNSSNENEIYFAGKEIEVRYVNEKVDDTWMNRNFSDHRGTIICHTEKPSRVSLFHFESIIDSEDNLMGVHAYNISTLPYINENGYWVINEVLTNIKATGKDAGNPNIIIIETTDTNGGVEIKAGAKKELLKDLEWKGVSAKIEPLEKINLNNLTYNTEFDYIEFTCSVPDLHMNDENSDLIKNETELVDQLTNALIINITPISCINYENSKYTEEEIENLYGKYGIITTIWTFNDETNEFEYLKKSDSKTLAADFNYISNINNLIQYAVGNIELLHPDNFEYTQIVFDRILTSLKNNSSNTKVYIYPNIVNKLAKEYNSANYNNDVNFTFKANNYVQRSNNDRNIDSLSQSGDEKFFNTKYNLSDTNSTNIVTNSLYVYNGGGSVTRYNEYIPNYDVPSLDLGEVLTRNETLLNRLNILSFDVNGTAYLSYIGTSFENEKNILTIGTSNMNINMGTDTLISKSERNLFEEQNKLEINFEEIEIGSSDEYASTTVKSKLIVNEDIYSDKNIWNRNNVDINSVISNSKNIYYTGIITPTSRYIYELEDKYSDTCGLVELNSPNINIADSESNLGELIQYNLYSWAEKKNKLYAIVTTPEYYMIHNQNNYSFDYKIYFSDGIYIPVLLSQIGLDRFILNTNSKIDMRNVNITSNMEIIKVNNSPLLLLSSSTNLYPDKYIYERRNSVGDGYFETVSNFTYSLFTANPIKITYYITGEKLNIHMEELYAKNKFVTTRKVKQNYFI